MSESPLIMANGSAIISSKQSLLCVADASTFMRNGDSSNMYPVDGSKLQIFVHIVLSCSVKGNGWLRLNLAFSSPTSKVSSPLLILVHA